MADLPGTLGYLTVTGKGVLALADSNDVGDQPDQIVAAASVTFTPQISSVDVLVSLSDDMFIIPRTITCTLNSDGRLVPPADGISSDPTPDAPTHVQLLAPNQPALNFTGWKWSALIAPTSPSAGWSPFAREFSGEPGEEISLAQAAAMSPPTGVLQMNVFVVDTTDEPFPTGYRVGVDALLTPDNKLWRTEA